MGIVDVDSRIEEDLIEDKAAPKKINLNVKTKEIKEKTEMVSAIVTKDLNLWYGEKQALEHITMKIPKRKVTALIGPSGCGKTTLLRCFNRMNDVIDSVKIKGDVLFHGHNMYEKGIEITSIRKRIGMVFQKPNPFPMTVYENISYGPRI